MWMLRLCGLSALCREIASTWTWMRVSKGAAFTRREGLTREALYPQAISWFEEQFFMVLCWPVVRVIFSLVTKCRWSEQQHSINRTSPSNQSNRSPGNTQVTAPIRDIANKHCFSYSSLMRKPREAAWARKDMFELMVSRLSEYHGVESMAWGARSLLEVLIPWKTMKQMEPTNVCP